MGRKAWWLGLVLMTAACGGGSGATAKAPGAPSGFANESFGSSQPAPPPSPLGGSEAKSVAAAPATDSAPSSAPRSERADRKSGESRADRERPGLGTEWGESRNSRIREMAFERQSDDPTSVVSIHYNDRDGARALAGFRDARPIPTGGLTALGGAVRVTVEGDEGSRLETVRIADRNVVIGTAGQRYAIVLTNRTGRRFEAVASVDGLDVMNGRPASFEQRGYILLPFATLRIEGFRQSERSVAAFRFSKVSESYAAQTGSARNVGVIGVAFFKERNDTGWSEGDVDFRDTASPFPGEPGRFAQPPR